MLNNKFKQYIQISSSVSLNSQMFIWFVKFDGTF